MLKSPLQRKYTTAISLILLLSVLGIFVLNAFSVQAQDASGMGSAYRATMAAEATTDSPGVFYYLRNPHEGVLYALDWVLHGVVTLVGKLINLIASAVMGVLKHGSDFTKARAVVEGSRIVRGFANMFFALILLIIAFATILRIETYGMKSLLPKLLIAALLVNFSLVIASPVVNFSNVLTGYFIEGMGGEDASVNIAKSLNLASIMSSKGFKAEKGTEVLLTVLRGLLVALVLSIVVLFTFVALLILLIIRILFIWFLLILAPIVFLLWVLPNTRPLFTKWWNKLLQWSFFAPIYVFFIWLALRTFDQLVKQDVANAINARNYSELSQGIFVGGKFLEFILMIGILLGGLIAAQKMGIYGASGMVKLGQGAVKGTRKWTAKRAQIAAAPAAKAIGAGLTKALGGIPGFRQLARPFRYAAEKERKAVAKSKDYYKNWTEADLKNQFRAVSPRDKLAISQVLAERGELNTEEGLREEDITKGLKIAKRYVQHRDILKARPDLAPNVDEDIQETVGRIKPADMEKLQIEAITLPKTIQEKIAKGEKLTDAEKHQQANITQTQAAVLYHLSNDLGKWRSSHLSKAADNPKLFVELRQNIVQPYKATFRQDIQNYLNNWAGQNLYG